MKLTLKKVAVIAGTIAASTVVAGAAYSLAPLEVTRAHYSDATYSTEVGRTIKHCDGETETHGRVTNYTRTIWSTPCR